MYYQNKTLNKYFPTFCKWGVFAIKKVNAFIIDPVVLPYIEKRIKEKLNTLFLDGKLNALIDAQVTHLLNMRLSQLGTDVQNRIEQGVQASEKVLQEKINSVNKRLEDLVIEETVTGEEELLKLLKKICLEMEAKFPQSKTGKIKKYIACLEIDKISKLPDTRLQKLRQSNKPTETVKYMKEMYALIDKIGEGL